MSCDAYDLTVLVYTKTVSVASGGQLLIVLSHCWKLIRGIEEFSVHYVNQTSREAREQCKVYVVCSRMLFNHQTTCPRAVYEGIDYRSQKAKKSNSNVLIDTSKDNNTKSRIGVFLRLNWE